MFLPRKVGFNTHRPFHKPNAIKMQSCPDGDAGGGWWVMGMRLLRSSFIHFSTVQCRGEREQVCDQTK